MSAYLLDMSAKEGEAANKEPGGGAAGGKEASPESLTCSQVLLIPPSSSIPLLLSPSQSAQPAQVRAPQRHISYTLSGQRPSLSS